MSLHIQCIISLYILWDWHPYCCCKQGEKPEGDESGCNKVLIYANHSSSLCTNTNWVEAMERFPHFTSEDRLLQFSSLTFAKDVPQPFLAYCQAALHSEHQRLAGPEAYELKGTVAYGLQEDILCVVHRHKRERNSIQWSPPVLGKYSRGTCSSYWITV